MSEETKKEYVTPDIEEAVLPDEMVKRSDIVERVEIPKLKIRYHKEMFPDLIPVECHGNFIDLAIAETVTLKAGEFRRVSLGVSMECPKGYWIQLVERSSTFAKYGVIQANGFGVIDQSYCGDGDIIQIPLYATRDVTIEANTRICQFTLVKDNLFTTEVVDKLGNPDRGGFGSTGN